MSYQKNAISGLASHLINIFLNLIVGIIVVRALGPSGKGTIAYFFLVFNVLVSYGQFGIDYATVHFFKRHNYSEQTVFNVNNTFLISIVILYGFILSLLNLSKIFLVDFDVILIMGGTVYVLFGVLYSSASQFFIGRQSVYIMDQCSIIGNIANFLSVLLLYLFSCLTIKTYIALTLFISFFKCILIWQNLDLSGRFKFEFNVKLIWDELKFGVILYFGALFIYLNYRVDQFFIKNLLGNADLGIYSLSISLAELLFFIPTSIKNALRGKLVSIDVSQRIKLQSITTDTIKYTFYLSFILVSVGIFMTPLIPILYGCDFVQSQGIIRILLVGILFANIGKISSQHVYATGKVHYHMFICLIVFLFNLVLNIFLIPIFGLQGAAYASTISYACYGIFYISYLVFYDNFVLRRFLQITTKDIGFFKYMLKLNKKAIKL